MELNKRKSLYVGPYLPSELFGWTHHTGSYVKLLGALIPLNEKGFDDVVKKPLLAIP